MSTIKTGKNTEGNKITEITSGQSLSDKRNSTDISERSRYILNITNDWINSADSKISTSCGIVSVATAVLIFVAENILSKIDISNGAIEPWRTFFVAAAIGVIVTFLLSLFFHIRALSPNFFSGNNNCSNNPKKKCLLFFEDIKDYKDAEEYISAVRKKSEEQFEDDVLQEVYNNSKICSQKMHRFKTAIWIAFASIILIILCAMCYFFMYNH